MALDSNAATERVLVLMPTRTDADHTAHFLRENQMISAICGDLGQVCQELRIGAGAVLLTDDVLLNDTAGKLAEALRAQPAWSAVPILVVAHERSVGHLQRMSLDTLGSVTIIERPLRAQTLVGMVASALRTRRHQYQIRDAIAELDSQAAELVSRDEKLRFALAASGLGSWELDLANYELSCSIQCKSHFGRAADEPFSYQDLRDSIHPADKDRMGAAVETALERGTDYDIEYRVCKPNGDVRWVMVRGRVAYDDHGAPLRMAGVSLDITERKRLVDALQASESELAHQASQLRNNDCLKDDFIATLAHELRNPLAPIRTGLELLRSVQEPQSSARTLSIMQRQLQHMVRLIDDLLDVSRITQGKLELKREPMQLSAAIDAALESSRPALELGQHTLSLSLTEEPLWMQADLTRVAQVLSNLLNNACKYTPNGGNIQLSTRREDDYAVIEVTDNGVGIPSDRLDHVFVMFSQLRPAGGSSKGGLGIGLALVRRLVEMHGGTVHATSKGPGHGSTFRVRLPLVADASAVVAAKQVRASSGGTRILVVDDNEDAAELLSLMLEHDGHTTSVACDGQSALVAAAEFGPEIIFLDIGLPDLSGYDVARRLRQDPRFANTVLIALTGWGTTEDKRRAAAAGFDLHLTKPIDSATVHSVLEQVGSVDERARPGRVALSVP